ncbi:MAG: Transcriptional regulatory protein TcrA [Stenotrophomonas maltophilia]|uniref:Transcriptional regulatory protein TcrA n=1 Tax=Stenotrophomonas maltophilia TaxID=40324 RepID=A0A7V8FJ55_STEMA|nr:MAG: Transcriptional regulatory protein TcrA [Stenotrophomonas maltophilia]
MADHAAVPTGLHVLVVEDEAAIRSMVVEVLGEAGYHVQQVADGSAALELLRGPGLFDVLVTDVGLAGSLNGRQLADAARQTRPQLPVLFVTGYAGFAAVGAGQLDAGMQILTKPFTAAELLARLRGLGEPGATNDPEPPLSTEVLAG